ncbi:MAG: hypothetical protein AB7E81_08485 [Hyphomicrobiaceae bacterium]
MKLSTDMSLSSPKWQIARIVAVVFLVVACGLLTSSLLDSSATGVAQISAPTWAMR